MTRCLLPDQATAAFEQWPDASVYNLDINGQYAPPSLRQARQRVSHCVFCRTILHHAMHRSLVRARSAPLTRHTVLMLRLCWQPGISRLLLVKHAADPNKRDEAGCTPLIFAAYAGFAKGVEMLLKKGAECDARDRLGHTALHSVASALDQVKTRWTKPAEDGSSPGYFTMYGHCLSAAITLGHSPFLPLPFFHFFRLGNYRDEKTWFWKSTTAEKRAVATYQCAPSIRYQPTKGYGQADERHTRTAKLLIEKCELSPLDENSFGESAVDLARMYGFDELVALFEELEPGAALSEDDQVDWAAKHARDRERPPGNQQVDDSIGHAGQEEAIMAVFDGDGDGVVVRDELAEAL